MTDRQQKRPIPQFATYAEEAAFWDTHDLTDYFDDFQPTKLRLVKPLASGVTVRFDAQTLDKLREEADKKGIGATTLIRMWVKERLSQTA